MYPVFLPCPLHFFPLFLLPLSHFPSSSSSSLSPLYSSYTLPPINFLHLFIVLSLLSSPFLEASSSSSSHYPLPICSSIPLSLLTCAFISHFSTHPIFLPDFFLLLLAGCWWRAFRMSAGTVVIAGGILATVILLTIVAVLCLCRLQVWLSLLLIILLTSIQTYMKM